MKLDWIYLGQLCSLWSLWNCFLSWKTWSLYSCLVSYKSVGIKCSCSCRMFVLLTPAHLWDWQADLQLLSHTESPPLIFIMMLKYQQWYCVTHCTLLCFTRHLTQWSTWRKLSCVCLCRNYVLKQVSKTLSFWFIYEYNFFLSACMLAYNDSKLYYCWGRHSNFLNFLSKRPSACSTNIIRKCSS